MSKIVALFILVLTSSSLAFGQGVKVDPEQRYLLLATTRTGTMQNELNEAAAEGYRLLPRTTPIWTPSGIIPASKP